MKGQNLYVIRASSIILSQVESLKGKLKPHLCYI